MSKRHQRGKRGLTPAARTALDASAGMLVTAVLKAARLAPRRRVADALGLAMRKTGPWLGEHRIGRANLVAAFPEKSPAEIERILAGVWDNLGRVTAELTQIERLTSSDPPRSEDDIYAEPEIFERFCRFRDERKATLVFAAHLANWELPALIAARYGLEAATLFRRPNVRSIADAVIDIRANAMGKLIPTGLDAPVRLLRELQDGRSVAMLVDQHFEKGVDVTFFGRPCKANPLIAQLARHVESPIRGTRVVRRADKQSFLLELTEPIEPARDADGKIDLAGTMQVITTVVEGWVREHPEQWLWLHRRWR